MSKEKLTNQLKNAYKQLEEEFKNKGRPNTIEDNNVDYDNCNIYAMRQKISDLEAKLAESEEENETFRKALRGEIFINYEIPMENERLKQELAEKDKLINDYADLAVKEIKAEDFAIEQIQKAWDMFSEEYFANEKMETLATRFLARLNQQIQELRGENV